MEGPPEGTGDGLIPRKWDAEYHDAGGRSGSRVLRQCQHESGAQGSPTPSAGGPPRGANHFARRAAALISDAGRRIESLMARHDWPLISALMLAVAASVETLIYTGGPATSDGSTALLLNLMATLPLALRPKHLAVATAIVTSATFLAIAGSATLTASAVLGQMAVLYLAAARYQRLTSVLLAVPFLVIALSGSSSAVSGLALLVLAVAALVIGDSRRMRSEAIADATLLVGRWPRRSASKS